MTSSIMGQVTDAAGVPIAGASVAIASSDRPHRDIAAVSGDDGSFRLGGLPPGRYVIEARHAGTVTRVQADVADASDAAIEIRLG